MMRDQTPAIGAAVAVIDGRNGPQAGRFLGLDRIGRARVALAGGNWTGHLSQVIA